MRAKVAKTKILELDFRRRITIVCFLFAAQGTRTWTLADIAELLNRLFRSLLWLSLRPRTVVYSRLRSMFAADGAALAAAVSLDGETVREVRGGAAAPSSQVSGLERPTRPRSHSPEVGTVLVAFWRSTSAILSTCREFHLRSHS
jgi:hypothetical protein